MTTIQSLSLHRIHERDDLTSQQSLENAELYVKPCSKTQQHIKLGLGLPTKFQTMRNEFFCLLIWDHNGV